MAPTLTATAVSTTQINLSWNAVSGATSYLIYSSSNDATTPIATTAAGVITYHHTGLAPGSTYYYQIIAVGVGGDSPWSKVANATTLPTAPTLAVTGLSASQITLSWNAISGATSYKIWSSINGGTTPYKTTTTYTFTGLKPDTTYYFYVTASDAGGDSAPSNEVSPTTKFPPQGIGFFSPGGATWYLRYEDSAGNWDAGQFQFGNGSWIPVVGDWDGSGHTELGLYDPNNGVWHLCSNHVDWVPSGGTDTFGDSVAFFYGYAAHGVSSAAWKPVTGDWNGSGRTEVGLFDPNNAIWHLSYTNVGPGGVGQGATLTDTTAFQYGGSGWIPVTGDWSGSGVTGIAAVNPYYITGYIFGIAQYGDEWNILNTASPFVYGWQGVIPIVGDWYGWQMS